MISCFWDNSAIFEVEKKWVSFAEGIVTPSEKGDGFYFFSTLTNPEVHFVTFEGNGTTFLSGTTKGDWDASWIVFDRQKATVTWDSGYWNDHRIGFHYFPLSYKDFSPFKLEELHARAALSEETLRLFREHFLETLKTYKHGSGYENPKHIKQCKDAALHYEDREATEQLDKAFPESKGTSKDGGLPSPSPGRYLAKWGNILSEISLRNWLPSP